MINIGYYGDRRRRPYYNGGLGGLVSILPAGAAARFAANGSTETQLVSQIRQQVEYNAPTVPSPPATQYIRQQEYAQSYAYGSGGVATGQVGGESTQAVFQVMDAAADPTSTTPIDVMLTSDIPSTAQDVYTATANTVDQVLQHGGALVDSAPDILAVSPTVATTNGSFLRTWGPPLAVVLGVGLAVYILRS